MKATFLEPLGETPEPSASCTNCPAVLRLERALEQLQRDFRREVGYWKSQHAKAVKRIKQLEEELDQSRGQVHALQDKLFGRKSEKSAQGNRSNDLFDPQEVGTTPKKRGAQHGHAGHGRRDYSHLPVVEEFVGLPEESLACPICGQPAAMMSDTEDSEVLEIDVRRTSTTHSPATVSSGVRLRFHATNAGGSAAAETDSKRQLRHFDLGACLVGQVFVLSAHGTVARAARTVRFGPAGRHDQ